MIEQMYKRRNAVIGLPAWCSAMLLIVAILGMTTTTARAQSHITLHVDIANGSPTGDGLSWTNAMQFLQDALADAETHVSQDPINNTAEIWVAAGTYRPDQRAVNGASAPCEPYGDCNQTHSFHLRNNVRILGGFSGDEITEDERDWETNFTILSGDLKEDDNFYEALQPLGSSTFSDNSLKVVQAGNVNRTAVLDGFFVQSSYNVLTEYPPDQPPQGSVKTGAGLYIEGGSPTVRHCTFQWNHSTRFDSHGSWDWYARGAGVQIRTTGETPAHFYRCTFLNNFALLGGAAIYIAGVEPDPQGVDGPGNVDLIKCVMRNNVSDHTDATSGAVQIVGAGAVTFVNCDISDNHMTN